MMMPSASSSASLDEGDDSVRSPVRSSAHSAAETATTGTNHSTAPDTPFFADAVLDLEEAHDIAETPEAVVRKSTTIGGGRGKGSDQRGGGPLQVPNLKNNEQLRTASSAVALSASPSVVLPNNNNTASSKRQSGISAEAAMLSDKKSSNDNNMTNAVASVDTHDADAADVYSGNPTNLYASPFEEKTRFHRISFEVEPSSTIVALRNMKRPSSPPRWPRDFAWAVSFWLVTPVGLLYPIVTSYYFYPQQQDQASLEVKNTTTNITTTNSNITILYSSSPLASYPLSVATLHALLWAAVAAFVLSRILYRSLAGGDGDDARHIASQVLLLSAPLSVMACIILVVFVWWACPTARIAVLVPLWYTIRDLYLFRRWKRRNEATPLVAYNGNNNNNIGGNYHINTISSASTSSRQAFFQALTCMALDILSRSLRRQSFYRVLSALLVLQLIVLMLWRWAILAALSKLTLVMAAAATSPSSASQNEYYMAIGMFIWTCLAGKWATGVVARLLTLLACGGVTSWFMQQSALLQEATTATMANISNHNNSDANQNDDPVRTQSLNSFSDAGSDGQLNINMSSSKEQGTTSTPANLDMPEAYRTVDASVYTPVLKLDDDAFDDDYDLEDEEDRFLLEAPSSSSAAAAAHMNRRAARVDLGGGGFGAAAAATVGYYAAGSSAALNNLSAGAGAGSTIGNQGSTVKSILWAGLTVSFGSVAICGLLGGPAQFVWSQVRKVDAARSAISQARSQLQQQQQQQQQQHGSNGSGMHSISNTTSAATTSGFRSMPVTTSSSGAPQQRRRATFFSRLCEMLNQLARSFVRQYSDLAMTHVAGYYKSYQRAARDVAILIDQTGVEPILHDDISTHMCACVGGTISVAVVILTTYIMLHQIDHSTTSSTPIITDWNVTENMLLSFVLCYTLVFTVMEPLRAAIKAVYVSFAQHPTSLSQAFPLIFHRLSRLSESNIA